MALYVVTHKRTKEEVMEQAAEILAVHPEYKPVEVVTLKGICSSWWGKAWCENLERYAMWEDRLTHGKKYLRDGSVIDLEINGGEIKGLVIGSRIDPYEVHVKIKPILPERQKEIEKLSSGKIQNLEELLSGNFSEDLKEIFFRSGILFPRPDEIDFECTCNDWANMCRHVAAVLYGIAVRLDENPLLFFQMRGIDIRDFVNNAVQGRIETMLANMENETPRIMKDENLTDIFGMEVPVTEVEKPAAKAADVQPVKKYRGVQDFRPDEIMPVYYRIQEIGVTLATLEFYTSSSVLKAIRSKALKKIRAGEAEAYIPTGIQTSVRVKHSEEFTDEEKAKYASLSLEIGREKAALEAGTSVSIIDEWRKDLTAQKPVEAREPVEIKEAPAVEPVSEDLIQLRIENALLKQRLEELTTQINRARAAIICLL